MRGLSLEKKEKKGRRRIKKAEESKTTEQKEGHEKSQEATKGKKAKCGTELRMKHLLEPYRDKQENIQEGKKVGKKRTVTVGANIGRHWKNGGIKDR